MRGPGGRPFAVGGEDMTGRNVSTAQPLCLLRVLHTVAGGSQQWEFHALPVRGAQRQRQMQPVGSQLQGNLWETVENTGRGVNAADGQGLLCQNAVVIGGQILFP